jgi:hypothetical protein
MQEFKDLAERLVPRGFTKATLVELRLNCTPYINGRGAKATINGEGDYISIESKGDRGKKITRSAFETTGQPPVNCCKSPSTRTITTGRSEEELLSDLKQALSETDSVFRKSGSGK